MASGRCVSAAGVTDRGLQLLADADAAVGWVGLESLVPLAGPRLRQRLHEAPLQLPDAAVVTQDLRLGLVTVLSPAHSHKSEHNKPHQQLIFEKKKETGEKNTFVSLQNSQLLSNVVFFWSDSFPKVLQWKSHAE